MRCGNPDTDCQVRIHEAAFPDRHRREHEQQGFQLLVGRHAGADPDLPTNFQF